MMMMIVIIIYKNNNNNNNNNIGRQHEQGAYLISFPDATLGPSPQNGARKLAFIYLKYIMPHALYIDMIYRHT